MNTPELPPHLDAASYDYDLPQHLIAQEPAPRRSDARLLHLPPAGTPGPEFSNRDLGFLTTWFRRGDLLVVNDTRVIKARLRGTRVLTGGRAEVLFLEERDGLWRCLVKTRGHLRPAEVLRLAEGALRITLDHRDQDGVWAVRADAAVEEVQATLDRVGRVPLPPYIRRDATGDTRDAVDADRYQTVYAEHPGAVAAPTAGLHLTRELLAALEDLGVERTSVTLHVGLGTFLPITVEDIREHPMHEEAWVVGSQASGAVARCRAAGGRIVPVGTTSVRVLETAADARGLLPVGSGRTRLFIHEPWRFRLVDALLTNFHAPRSTLVLLVAALVGRERLLRAYQHAVAEGYRFLSYGDAMFIG